MNPDAQMEDIQRNTEWLEARQREVLKRRRTISATRTLIEIRLRLQHEGRNLDRLFRQALGLLLLSAMPVTMVVYGQPIMPTMTVGPVDTNEVEVPQLATATLMWNRHTNALRYRWTNWNAWTNQGGVTTNLSVTPVTMVLGTNRAGVRVESNALSSAWFYITNIAYPTNLVGIPTVSSRTMSWSGGTWSPWMVTTQTWFTTRDFQQQWRLNIVRSNWWGLKNL